jgi:hypothetical protein
MQDFEKERKYQELIKEVYNKLAKEVEVDKIKIETLKQKCLDSRRS